MRFLEELCATILIIVGLVFLGYAWLMHAEAQREGVVIVGKMGGE